MNRFTRLFILLLASGLLVGGCSDSEKVRVKIGMNTWPAYEPFVLAQKEGYYPGVEVAFSRLNSNSDTVKAFAAGILDMAMLTMDEVLRLRQNEPGVKVVLVIDLSEGGDAIVAREGIASLNDLAGKTVGVESTALGAYVLTRALDHAGGLELGDLNIYPAKYAEHETLFLERKVDAVVTFEPVVSRLKQAGGRVIFDSRAIPGEIIDVLAVREAFALEHPEAVGAVVAGWFAALKHIERKPAEAMAAMACYEGVDAETFRKICAGMRIPSLEENRRLLGDGEGSIRPAVERIESYLKQHRLLLKTLPTDALFSTAFLPSGRP